MTDTTFGIQTKNAPNIRARFNSAPPMVPTRGATMGFEFWVTDNDGQDDLVVDSDMTIDSVVVYATVTINAGNTLTIDSTGTLYTGRITNNGTIINNGSVIIESGTVSGFQELIEYGDWAGKFSSLEMLDGTEKYREQIPTDASVNSIVLGIEPSQDLQTKDWPGVWGIVTGVEDNRNQSLNTENVGLSLRVLAEYDEYTDHAALESELLV